MKKTFAAISALVVIAASISIACGTTGQNTKDIRQDTVPVSNHEEQINRGRYLVNIMGCNDCHTPNIMTPQGPEKDTSRLLSGHPSEIPLPEFDKSYTRSWALFSLTGTAIAGPWGVSYAGNLASDETGIGNWSETQFFNAFTRGKYKGLENERTLLPPMPWQTYSLVRKEDISAIFAYLKSTRPIKNVVPAPRLQ